jgi:hypothetical protein
MCGRSKAKTSAFGAAGTIIPQKLQQAKNPASTWLHRRHRIMTDPHVGELELVPTHRFNRTTAALQKSRAAAAMGDCGDSCLLGSRRAARSMSSSGDQFPVCFQPHFLGSKTR